jgi:hypothetical protein
MVPVQVQMSKIIVSYRRSDSQAVAGRIVDRLIEHFGADAVFMDVDNIPFGVDFRDHIKSVFQSAAVLIAIVGPDWLGGDAAHRRIDDEDDPVRVEIEAALRQKLLVIPVLVNNATMPMANMLPESLRGFSFLNAAPVDSGRDFRAHVSRLIASIETVLPKRPETPIPGGATIAPGSSRRISIGLSIAIIAILLIAVGGAWWLGMRSSHPPAVTTPAPVAVNPPTASAPAVGPAANPPPAASSSSDDQDWATVQQINSYEAYQSYVRRHPDGRHVADAAKAAIAIALIAEPPAGKLPIGSTVLVDDQSCDADHIKQLVAGDIHKSIPREKKCVPRSNPF